MHLIGLIKKVFTRKDGWLIWLGNSKSDPVRSPTKSAWFRNQTLSRDLLSHYLQTTLEPLQAFSPFASFTFPQSGSFTFNRPCPILYNSYLSGFLILQFSGFSGFLDFQGWSKGYPILALGVTMKWLCFWQSKVIKQMRKMQAELFLPLTLRLRNLTLWWILVSFSKSQLNMPGLRKAQISLSKFESLI